MEKLEKKKQKYKEFLNDKDIGELEKCLYNTTNDEKKIEIELKRIKKYLGEKTKLLDKYGYDYYLLYKDFEDYKLYPTEELKNEIKQRIVDLEILCNIKIALLSGLFVEEQENKKIK